MKITGPRANRFVSFLRRDGDDQLLVIALRRMDLGGVTDLQEICADTAMVMPKASAPWRELLTGRKAPSEPLEVPLGALLDQLPFAIFAA